MTKRTLEQRFTKLEAKVNKLCTEFQSAKTGEDNGWQRAIERFGGDTDLQAVFEAAMKFREADRNRARKRQQKRPTKG